MTGSASLAVFDRVRQTQVHCFCEKILAQRATLGIACLSILHRSFLLRTQDLTHLQHVFKSKRRESITALTPAPFFG